MVRKLIPGLVVSSLCFLHSQLCGQGSTETPALFHSFSRVGVSAWAAGGAYVAGPSKSFMALHNPAALSTERFEFYVEAGKRLEANYPFGLKFDNQFIAPAMASISKGLGEWAVSAGYANYYDSRFEAQILESSEQFPDGTGAIIEVGSRSKVHTFFGSLKYEFGSHTAVGVTAGLNYLRVSEKFDTLDAEEDGVGFQTVVGGVVNISDEVTLGASFRFASDIDFEQGFDENAVVDSVDDGRGGTVILQPGTERTLMFPWSLQVGLGYKPIPQLRLLAMLDYQHWSSLSSGANDLTNLHLGMELNVRRSVIRVGFFTSENPSEFFGGFLDQNFLTAGVETPVVGGLGFSAMILDSHLLSNDDSDFHQTYVAGGLHYTVQ